MITLNGSLLDACTAALNALSALLPDLALKAGVLLLLALLIDLALRRTSSATRHVHWQLALGGALALALLQPLLPAVRIAVPLPDALTAQLGRAAPYGTPSAAPHPAPENVAARTPRLPTATRLPLLPLHQPGDALAFVDDAAHADHADHAGDARDERADDRREARNDRAARLHARTGAATEPSVALTSESMDSASPASTASASSRWTRLQSRLAQAGPGTWLTLAWAAGALVVLSLLAFSLLRARGMARAARPMTDPEWLALLDRTSRELSLQRRVQLLIADGPVVPMTWGQAHPVVLLPADAQQWSAPRRRQVLLHELAHVQRADWLTQLLAQVTCAIYWYQPLAWLAARRLRQEREHACDDRVLAAGNRASDYAGHLLDIARSRQVGLTGSFATLAMARPSQLEGRLLAVLDERRDRRALARARTLLAVSAAALVVLALACVQPKAEKADATPAPAAPPPPAAQAVPATPATPSGAHAAPGQDASVATAEPSDAPVATAAPTIHLAPSARAGRSRVAIAEPATPAPMADVRSLSALQALGYVVVPAPSAPGVAVAQLAPPAPPARAPRAGQPPRFAPLAPVSVPDMWREQETVVAYRAARAATRALSWNCSVDDDQRTWIWSDGDDKFTVKVQGDVEPDETATRVRAIDEEGLLSITHEHGGATDTIEVRGKETDEGESQLVLSGKLAGQDADAAALQAELDRLMPVIMSQTSLFASERVNYLLKHGGTHAVLDAIRALPDEPGRLAWYQALLQEHDLDGADFGAALKQAGQDLPSDASLAELLQCVGPDALGDPDLVESVFGAVDTLESDSVEAEALQALMCGEFADAPVIVRALKSATTGLESDAYMAQVLESVPGVRLRDKNVREAFLAALGTIESDAYVAEVVQQRLDERAMKGEALASLLASAASMVDSDAYLAGILEALPRRALADATSRAAALAALGTIESDAYAAEVLQAFLGSGDLPPAAVAEMLTAAAHGIDSDAYMAQVLQGVSAEALGDAGVKTAFDAAVATIASASYRAEVLEAHGSKPEQN